MRSFLMSFLDVAPPASEPVNMVFIVIFLAVVLIVSVGFVAALVFALILFKRRRAAQPSSPNQS